MRKDKKLLITSALILGLSVLISSCVSSGEGSGGSTSSISSPTISTTSQEEEKNPEGSWSHSDKIKYVWNKCYATGAKAHYSTVPYGLNGVDLGFPFYDPELKRLFVTFGDTNGGPYHGTWNSNITLYTDEIGNYENGIAWQGKLPGQYGLSMQVTPPSRNIANANGVSYHPELVTCEGVSTTIPTGVAVVNGTYYLFYMEVDAFDAFGGWGVYYNRVVKSSDKGQTWSVVPGLAWESMNASRERGIAPNFAQIYPFVDGDYMYIYGIPGGRSGGVQLGRVKLGEVEDFESYEYYFGLNSSDEPRWVKGTNGLKAIKDREQAFIISPQCAELCVAYNKYLRRYVIFYLQNNSAIVFKTSKTPWGAWSNSEEIMNQSDLPRLYGGFTCPELFTEDGKKMNLLVSQWTDREYQVFDIEVALN